ncbi:hypothetical protein [Actinoplanes sp. CA-252034]|uniref:hypothetical protein n=1 Tax=Actinoplanes sp. CA-252034 TaxID=3239906 RepID=UPI003D999DB1
MHTLTATVPIRDRRTGDLFDRPGPGATRIGTGFLPGRVPALALTGDRLRCLLADGAEVTLTAPFDADRLPPATGDTLPGQIVATGGGLLRAGADGRVRLDGTVLTRIKPGDTLLGMGDVTATGRPDLLVRRPDGGVSAWEPPGTPGGGHWHDLGSSFGDTTVVAVTLSSEGLAGLLALGGGLLTVYPHSGIFWPQDPAATFLPPVPVATGVADVDVIG